MRKDLDKLLSSTLKTYFIILIGIFIIKLFGIDYFGLNTRNEIIVWIDDFINRFHLEMVWYGITLYIYQYIIFSITCIDNSKKMKIYTLCTLPIAIVIQILKMIINSPYVFVIIDLLWLFMFAMIYIKIIKRNKIEKYNVSNYWIYCIINIIFQMISMCIRDIPTINQTTYEYGNFVNIIINFDYIILSIIAYKLFFSMGGKSLWVMVVSSFSHLLTLLKTLPTKLQNVYLNNKDKSRFEKISDSIYIPLFILWNIFTLVVVLFIATLNHTFAECIIILCSFWINKRTFGKAFHMPTAFSCFIVSNLTYYALNRITIPAGISLIISVILGIALCYITSKFVKTKKLYRGMSLNEYNSNVLDLYDEESVYYQIGKLFYVDRYSEQWIATKLAYSVPSIQKKKYELKKQVQGQ